MYITNEPGHSNITCATCEDSDQPAHSRRLIRVFAEHSVGIQANSEDVDKLVRMRMLMETKNTQKNEDRRLGGIKSLHIQQSSLRGCIRPGQASNLVGNGVPQLKWLYDI